MCTTLNIGGENGFGQLIYTVPSPKGSKGQVELSSLDEKKFWSIENPSDEVAQEALKLFNGAEDRTYGETRWIMSPAAARGIKKGDHFGATVVVTFEHEGELYVIAVADPKTWIQSAQGTARENEDMRDCALRELSEELAITNVSKDDLVEIGGWKFQQKVELIKHVQNGTTTAFHVKLPFEKVRHLLPNGEIGDQPFMIVDVKKDLPDVHLDRTLFVLFIRANDIESVPEEFEQIKATVKSADGELKEVPRTFVGHHRELIRKFCGFTKPKYDTSYLVSFSVTVPGQKEEIEHQQVPLKSSEIVDAASSQVFAGSEVASEDEPP